MNYQGYIKKNNYYTEIIPPLPNLSMKCTKTNNTEDQLIFNDVIICSFVCRTSSIF